MDIQQKAAYSVSEMCRLLKMSRTQFYEHMKKGTFHNPSRLSNNRPYFTALQVADNLKAKETGVGINGEYVLFYIRTTPLADANYNSVGKRPTQKSHRDLINSLKSLGLNPTIEQLEKAINNCFPMGTDDFDETDVLRKIFRHLKFSESK